MIGGRSREHLGHGVVTEVGTERRGGHVGHVRPADRRVGRSQLLEHGQGRDRTDLAATERARAP